LNLDFSFLTEDAEEGKEGNAVHKDVATSTHARDVHFSVSTHSPAGSSSSLLATRNQPTNANERPISAPTANNHAGHSAPSSFTAAFAHIKATPSYVPPAPRPVDASPAQQFRAPNPRAILVSRRQKGNPVLNFIRNVPWEYGDIVADYQMGSTSQTCALFLSVRYHMQKHDYIYGRMQQLQKGFKLRVLLCLVDQEECQKTLLDVHTAALVNGWTLILSWSPEEAAR